MRWNEMKDWLDEISVKAISDYARCYGEHIDKYN